jgi:ATP-binding cassette subfamily B multidrug efflux pump
VRPESPSPAVFRPLVPRPVQWKRSPNRWRTKKPHKPDEDPVGKVYDSRLIRRLAHYLGPYWIQATVSALSITCKSLSDVTGPYLVKVAIDRYLTGAPGPRHQLAHAPPSC